MDPHPLHCTPVDLFILRMFFYLLKYSLVVFPIIGGETGGLDWFNEIFKDLCDWALLLFFENVEEEHQFVFALFAELDVLYVFVKFLFELLFQILFGLIRDVKLIL